MEMLLLRLRTSHASVSYFLKVSSYVCLRLMCDGEVVVKPGTIRLSCLKQLRLLACLTGNPIQVKLAVDEALVSVR